jgi:cyclomaltodextrinase
MIDDDDSDFHSGSLTVRSLPSVYYLNLTNRCQLKCRYCITASLKRNGASGVFDMSSEVLDALSEYIRQAGYIGLCHAGEPMLSPAFKPLLGITAAIPRQSRPIIHLMTNGELLDSETFRTGVDAGISSWMVSIDGLTRQTHDFLRPNSNIDALQDKLIEISTIRARECPDVRIGISWTINRLNYREIEQLPDRASAWGIDYIKFEEMVPVNHEAEQLAAVPGSLLYPVLYESIKRGKGLGLTMLNHYETADMRACGITSSPVTDDFFKADRFANRLPINPCRAPYTTIFIEPGGSVKPGSFNCRNAAGNILDTALDRLWNNHYFKGCRALSVSRRICKNHIPTC